MHAVYRFGSFELQCAQRRLLADGRPAALGPRAFDVLIALVDRAGDLVTKEELLERVWPKLVVEENNLQVQVSALRKAIGQEAIATIPGRGYRFTLPLAAAGPPSAVMPSRHNLPAQLTSFVGHEDDVADYAALLRDTRLLTLTGIGGCGKTRLALEVAQAALPSFREGVWFVDLAAVAAAPRLPIAILAALNLRNPIDASAIETLCDHFSSRQALLMLDNCEHLAGACAELTQRLLAAAPQLRVLATSREGLNVPGERIVAVRSLRIPAAGAETDLDAARSSEAMRLFVERVRAADRTFALDAANVGAVAEICRRLDGIPLAIELAAARIKVLSVEEIRARLNDSFRLLVSGRSAALPRQQTLLAVVRWSYDHLEAEEQRLLRLLTVFAGGWTLAGAVHVIGGGADEYVALDSLTHLVDRSLVTIERHDDGTTRYAMLETVRQYAAEQLDAEGEAIAARDRHFDYCLLLAAQKEAVRSAREHHLWQLRLQRELENMLQALAWASEAQDGAEKQLQLAIALQRFWFHSGLLRLGYDATRAAIERGAGSEAARFEALLSAAALANSIDRYEDGKAHAREALDIARKRDDAMGAARALRSLAYVRAEEADYEEAVPMMQEALSAVRTHGDDDGLVTGLNAMAELYRGVGDMGKARPLYEEALELARRRSNVVMIAHISDNLARLLIAGGMTDAARKLVHEVVVISNEAHSRWIGLCAFDIASALAAIDGDWLFAARMRGAAEARVRAMRYRRDRADEAFLEPWTTRIREALAADDYRTAFDVGAALPDDVAGAEAFAWLESNEAERCALAKTCEAHHGKGILGRRDAS